MRPMNADKETGTVLDGLAEVYNKLGIALGMQGKLEEALVNIEQALQFKSNYAGTYEPVLHSFSHGPPRRSLAGV